eukprot:CAMPEP_0167749336 /NCGR_PEP_ID=MMETSP0110_2-20121227/5349_1 /TAXON_ID=629695 /ORGANISM="Gymnochlora sp., Strain CCMP2014" /LENGTH=193 /DNA_ID=CAMNT_0007634475 /DNA_START=376 /DNA_END=954 /DNA_ORIENTATION=+
MVENKDGSTAPMQFDLAQIMMALRAQSSQKKKMKGEKLKDPPMDGDKKNTKFILCTQCNSKILKPGKSTYTEKKMSLHNMVMREEKKSQSTQELSKFWLVTSQFDFENVGVSKNVSTAFKYLACADCDLGPIGIQFTNKPSEFYIAHDRVAYGMPPETAEKKPVGAKRKALRSSVSLPFADEDCSLEILTIKL